MSISRIINFSKRHWFLLLVPLQVYIVIEFWGLYALGGFIGFLAFMFFAIGPVAVRFTTKHSSEPVRSECDLSELNLEQYDFLRYARESLEREGFKLVGFFTVQRETKANIGIYQHNRNRDCAMLYTSKKLNYAEYTTEFNSGAELNTNNNSTVNVFSKYSDKEVFHFPQVKDMGHLYAIHNALIERHFRDTEPKYQLLESNEVDKLNREITKDYEMISQKGYLYYEEKSRSFRPTWKGAFIPYYKVLWSTLPIYHLLLRKRSRDLIKELGVSNPPEKHPPGKATLSRAAYEAFDGERWNAVNYFLAMSELSDLSPTQRKAYLAYWYFGETQNGGHWQYFCNKVEFDQQEVIESLEEIDANAQADILKQAVARLPANIHYPDTVDEFIDGYSEVDMEDLDILLGDCSKDILAHLHDYLDRYEDEFIEWIP